MSRTYLAKGVLCTLHRLLVNLITTLLALKGTRPKVAASRR